MNILRSREGGVWGDDSTECRAAVIPDVCVHIC